MPNVRNNSAGRLTVAGVSIRPGATVAIRSWSPELADARESALLASGAIDVVAPAEPEAEEKPEKGEKPKPDA